MVERGRRLRRFFHPRRSDLLFVIGATGFFTEVIGDEVPRNGIIVASLALMGVPLFNRAVGNGKNGGKNDDRDR